MHKEQILNGPVMTGAGLLLAELVHRVANEYTSAIGMLRAASIRASNDEARKVLSAAAGRLNAYANAHVLLRPPTLSGEVDLAEHLSNLCKAVALAQLNDRAIKLSINSVCPIMLESERCWRAGLIVSELITNAARHAFTMSNQIGAIVVSVGVRCGHIVCEVSDTGVWNERSPGLGSAVVDSLAADLDGLVGRRSDASGTTVELSFPQSTARRSVGMPNFPVGPRTSTLGNAWDALLPA